MSAPAVTYPGAESEDDTVAVASVFDAWSQTVLIPFQPHERQRCGTNVQRTLFRTITQTRPPCVSHQHLPIAGRVYFHADLILILSLLGRHKALNGQSYLDAMEKETGTSLSVVPQEEEARLGFQTAVAAVEASDGVAPQDMVVWDSGGGS